MAYETIAVEVAAHVLTLTLDRPDALNAVNPAMVAEILDAIARANADDDVRAIIVTGSGRAFCAGADISGGSSAFDFDSRPDKAALGSPVRADGFIDYAHPAVRDNGGRIALALFGCLKPVIGAINGAAVGLGATMLLPMDIRLAAEGARFSFPFARRGLVQEACSSWFLPRIVGISTAMEWCLTGRMFSASEAQERGLVRSLHSEADLLAQARHLAREIAENAAPVSVAMTRQLLWNGLATSTPLESHALESRSIYVRGRARDLKEGILAFKEKRQPMFEQTVSADLPAFFPLEPLSSS